MPDLSEIIDAAKEGKTILPPEGRDVVVISFQGEPSHLMSNAVAASLAEIEDLFLAATDIVGGRGDRHGLTVLAAPKTNAATIQRMDTFFRNSQNAHWFCRRYGIASISMATTGKLQPG